MTYTYIFTDDLIADFPEPEVFYSRHYLTPTLYIEKSSLDDTEILIDEKTGKLEHLNPSSVAVLCANAIFQESWRSYEDQEGCISHVFLTPMRIVMKESPSPIEGLIPCPLHRYNYFNRRIGISGGPSSGKSSLAKTLALKINNSFKGNASDVAEYATTFIQKTGRIPTLEDQIWLYVKQKENEAIVGNTANMVFSDSPVWLQCIYALRAMRGKRSTPVTDHTLSSLAVRAVEALDLYDNHIVLAPVQYEENNVRYHSMQESQEITESCETFLSEHGREYKTYTYNDIDQILMDILYLNIR